MIGIYLGNKKIKSIYLGNKKIKKIYLGNSLVYQDSKPNGLYFLKFGDTQLTQRKIVPIKYQTTSELNLLKMEVN